MTKSILIVDDDQDIQGILQRILEEEGYTVGQIPVEPDRDFASRNGRRKAISFSMLFVLFVLWLPRAQTASADGGAPDLAYVAGTAPGVSVIDVAQQHVRVVSGHALPRRVSHNEAVHLFDLLKKRSFLSVSGQCGWERVRFGRHVTESALP